MVLGQVVFGSLGAEDGPVTEAALVGHCWLMLPDDVLPHAFPLSNILAPLAGVCWCAVLGGGGLLCLRHLGSET